MTTTPDRVTRGAERNWVAPLGLMALGFIPLLAGTLRLIQLAGGPDVLPADPRFASTPVPLVAHIVAAAIFVLIGAVQFVPRLRKRGHSWHRRAGRVVAAAGLVVAGSAIWMTLLYAQKPGTGVLLFLLRLVFAPAMAAALVLGVLAIRRHDVFAHRAWMMRAYAIGLAAGTQAFTEGIGDAVFGTGTVRDDVFKGMGWVINLAVAEWVIRRQTR